MSPPDRVLAVCHHQLHSKHCLCLCLCVCVHVVKRKKAVLSDSEDDDAPKPGETSPSNHDLMCL